jgi:hypothetical protein
MIRRPAGGETNLDLTINQDPQIPQIGADPDRARVAATGLEHSVFLDKLIANDVWRS